MVEEEEVVVVAGEEEVALEKMELITMKMEVIEVVEETEVAVAAGGEEEVLEMTEKLTMKMVRLKTKIWMLMLVQDIEATIEVAEEEVTIDTTKIRSKTLMRTPVPE